MIARKTSLYLNGILNNNSTEAISGTIILTTHDVVVGKGAPKTPIDEFIYNVRIYDAALSSSQIKQNYITGLDSLLSKELISKEEYNARIEALSQK